MAEPNFNELIPELRHWNNGDGIDVSSWIGCVGNLPLAIGFGSLFWPNFVIHRGYVLFSDFSEGVLKSFIDCAAGDRRAVEATMNHRHLLDFFCEAHGAESVTQPNEAQLRHFGQLLCEMWQAKVDLDLPGEQVVVTLHDDPGDSWIDWQITVFHGQP